MVKPLDVKSQLGLRVRQLRQAKGLSQEAFATLCGLDRTYISGIERGKRNVSLLKLKLITDGLGVSLAKLLQGLGNDCVAIGEGDEVRVYSP